jgi:hypothetical protein
MPRIVWGALIVSRQLRAGLRNVSIIVDAIGFLLLVVGANAHEDGLAHLGLVMVMVSVLTIRVWAVAVIVAKLAHPSLRTLGPHS